MIEVSENEIKCGETANQLLLNKGFNAENFLVYDRVRDKLLSGEELVYDPIILPAISGG